MASRQVPAAHRANHSSLQFSNRFIDTAMGGASAIAIFAALIAIQTSPAAAACPTGTPNINITGICNGSAEPSGGTLTNSGDIQGVTYGVIVGTGSIITAITNSGTIGASLTSAYALRNNGWIGSLSNSGSIIAIAGTGGAFAIFSQGSIGNLSNTGTISASASATGYAFGIYNPGSIGSLSNSGMISASALSSGVAYGVYSSRSIGSLSNSGSIRATAQSSGSAHGIYTYKPIDVLTNSGTINASAASGNAYGILNDSGGSIGNLSNSGAINASASSGIAIGISNNGSIGTLLNAQGGNGSLPAQTALTYSYNLPGTYLEYVTSSTHYGQLLVTGGAGTIGSFGIAEGSTLANGTYASVLSGVGTVGATSGINGSIMGSVSVGSGFANWTLLNIGSDVWDLIISGLVSGVDAVNTLIELGFTRDEILEALRGRAAAMNNALNYDCMTFNENGVCISFNARYTSLNDMNEGAGVMKAALRLSPTTHVGAFIDYAGKPDTQGVLAYEDGMPMIGGFLGFRQELDGTGLKARIAAARHTDDVTITRSATLENTEAGSGSSSLTNWAIGAELGYGLALSNQSNLTPYIGLRYGTAEMDGYAEGSSDTVEYTLTLNALSQNLTTATAGLRLDGMLGDQLTYEIAAGIEYDLKSDANEFSGSSTIPDLTTFSLENTADANRLRGSGSFALGYAITPNQKLTTSVSVRGEAYSDKVDTSVMAGYQIQF